MKVIAKSEIDFDASDWFDEVAEKYSIDDEIASDFPDEDLWEAKEQVILETSAANFKGKLTYQVELNYLISNDQAQLKNRYQKLEGDNSLHEFEMNEEFGQPDYESDFDKTTIIEAVEDDYNKGLENIAINVESIETIDLR